jgi:hypothetical protein
MKQKICSASQIAWLFIELVSGILITVNILMQFLSLFSFILFLSILLYCIKYEGHHICYR